MTIACSEIIARAQAFSPLNTPLTTDSAEMLSRIRADQKALFTSVASVTRDYFQTTSALTSTGGASGRSFDVSALSSPLERILQVTLGDGRIVSQVDVLDVEAELSPRYFVRGQKLVEVSSDWGTSGPRTATLVYVYGPTDVLPTGGTAQAVSLPDQWTDLLVIPLAMYLFAKDPGRDPAEYQRLMAMNDERQQAFLSFLKSFGGVESVRFVQPVPQSSKKQ